MQRSTLNSQVPKTNIMHGANKSNESLCVCVMGKMPLQIEKEHDPNNAKQAKKCFKMKRKYMTANQLS